MGTNTCSTLERRVPARRLEPCARRGYRRFTKSSTLTVDGVATGAGLPVATGAMRLAIRARDNTFFTRGHRHVRAALVGRAAMLAPLTPGAHTIVLRRSYHKFGTFTGTYQLTVAAAAL